MAGNINSPAEMVDINRNGAVVKTGNPTVKTLMMGILAGMFIAIGGAASSMVSILGDGVSPLAVKLLGSAIFTIGIVSVIIAGAELFTGNILISIGAFSKDITGKELITNWCKVWIFNLIGSVFFAWLMTASKIFPETAMEYFQNLALKKASMDLGTAFVRGVLCNILVCLSVWTAAAGKDGISKFFLSAFPVFIFVFLGFEHCVANMYYFPQALFLGADVSIGAIISRLLVVTLGNVVGGLIIATPYYITYGKKK